MRLAIFSDVHGQIGRLSACLDAIARVGTDELWCVTKRVHNMLHGYPGDGRGLDPAAREVYRAALEPNALELRALTRPGDVVILHDPQTAGLVPAMRAAGLSVIWRCHVGADNPNGEAHEVWDFLRPS